MNASDAVWLNAQLATFDGGDDGYGTITDGAVAVRDGRIAWVGQRAALPAVWRAARQHDCKGLWLTPGLIDCHTHVVHAGSRAGEFEQRLNGVSYEAIAKAGGGIVSTVRATRTASDEQLMAQSLHRLKRIVAEGVTRVEIKSGYGLTTADECKMLRVATKLGEAAKVRISRTFLGAHALPPEYTGRIDDYITLVCEEMLPAVVAGNLADAVDAFCERIAFTPEQTARVFKAAQALGLPVKLHADQLTQGGGAALAAAFGALSADHLEYSNAASIRAMAKAGTVAVLLPGAFYMLREKKLPPVAQLRKAGVRMAISTDCNPGTSPCTSLLLMLNMACTLFRLTPAEALQGVTCHGAAALGLEHEAGRLKPGLVADFAVWDITRPAQLAYALGANPCVGRVLGGVLCHD